MKTRLFLVFAFCASVLVSLSISNPSVSAGPSSSSSSSLYKITAIQGEKPEVSCFSLCLAAYDSQTQFPELGQASEIDTTAHSSMNGPNVPGGCAILQAGLKCWGGNTYGQLGNESTASSPTTLVTATDGGVALAGVTDVAAGSGTTCVVANSVLKCVGMGLTGATTPTNTSYSSSWKTIISSGVTKIVLGTGYGSPNSSSICVLLKVETVQCGVLSDSPTWLDAGVTKAKDITDGLCIAAEVSTCVSFSNAAFSMRKTVDNAELAESVYYQANAICFYRLKGLWCAPQSGSTTMTAKLIGIMPKPLSIINLAIGTSTQMFFFLPTGILSALASSISCTSCNTGAEGAVTLLSAFSSSTSTSYSNVESVNGFTDSADYIPLTITTGTRQIRSGVNVKVATSSGEPIAGSVLQWSAPDSPGTLKSGSNAPSTDSAGAATISLPNGPITFSLQGGTLASGAVLQAAISTVIVPTSGDVTVTIPDAPALVSRTVSVLLPDDSPVPNAALTIRNSFLMYAYQLQGSSAATYGARAKDPNGYFGQVFCAYCYAVSPAIVTGSNGKITFKTFNPASRSTSYDADVVYDDGELNQRVKKSFSSTNESVQLPFMVAIKATLTDTDPSTPDTIELKPDSDGAVKIESELFDQNKEPIPGFSQSVETVCDTMDQGGLVSSSSKVDTLCNTSTAKVSSSSFFSEMNKALLAHIMNVYTTANCGAVMLAKTSTTGKATLVICPTASTKYRIRGKGAVATKAFCVVVNGLQCGVTASSTTTVPPVITPTNTNIPVVVASTNASMKKGKVTSFTTINKTAKVSIPKGAKVVLVVAVTTKKFCSVSGTSVKALLPGSCTISVMVTPKGSKKTTTTKVKITVSQ